MTVLDRVASYLGLNETVTVERPPKPEDEQKSQEHEFDVYNVVIEYRNGDTEEFECHGRYDTDEHHITYNLTPTARVYNFNDKAKARYGFNRRKVAIELLGRDPIEEKVGTETWEVSWTLTHEEDTYYSGEFKRWKPKAVDPEIERVDRTEVSDGD